VVNGGVLTVTDGQHVAIACRQGTMSDDLVQLEADVAAMRAAEADASRRARVEQMRLHARAVRQLMRYLRPGQADEMAAGKAQPATVQGEDAS
jgi:F-type H+-transporting ATPase subunit epsilon